jgi:hypothetical protein
VESFCRAAIRVKRDATNARQGKIEKVRQPIIPLASNPVAETIIPVIIDVWLNVMKERLVHLVRLCQRQYHFRIWLDSATNAAPHSFRSYICTFGVTDTIAAQPQLKRFGNAVVDGIVYSPAHQG